MPSEDKKLKLISAIETIFAKSGKKYKIKPNNVVITFKEDAIEEPNKITTVNIPNTTFQRDGGELHDEEENGDELAIVHIDGLGIITDIEIDGTPIEQLIEQPQQMQSDNVQDDPMIYTDVETVKTLKDNLEAITIVINGDLDILHIFPKKTFSELEEEDQKKYKIIEAIKKKGHDISNLTPNSNIKIKFGKNEKVAGAINLKTLTLRLYNNQPHYKKSELIEDQETIINYINDLKGESLAIREKNVFTGEVTFILMNKIKTSSTEKSNGAIKTDPTRSNLLKTIIDKFLPLRKNSNSNQQPAQKGSQDNTNLGAKKRSSSASSNGSGATLFSKHDSDIEVNESVSVKNQPAEELILNTKLQYHDASKKTVKPRSFQDTRKRLLNKAPERLDEEDKIITPKSVVQTQNPNEQPSDVNNITLTIPGTPDILIKNGEAINYIKNLKSETLTIDKMDSEEVVFKTYKSTTNDSNNKEMIHSPRVKDGKKSNQQQTEVTTNSDVRNSPYLDDNSVLSFDLTNQQGGSGSVNSTSDNEGEKSASFVTSLKNLFSSKKEDSSQQQTEVNTSSEVTARSLGPVNKNLNLLTRLSRSRLKANDKYAAVADPLNLNPIDIKLYKINNDLKSQIRIIGKETFKHE